MEITVELPNDLAERQDPGREALEALAIAGYRSGQLSHFEARRLLGLTRYEFEGFLKDRNIFDHSHSAEDLEQDLESMRRFEEKRKKAESPQS